MGEFFNHLTETKWLNWKAWACACCCPNYVFAKVSYSKLKEDSYRLPVACMCPCMFAWWYMMALDKIPESIVTKILACAWTEFCPLCAIYVAAAEEGIDPVSEAKDCINLVKKVVCISRS